jgi:cbb3-type cytochrome c oxidase subunit III
MRSSLLRLSIVALLLGASASAAVAQSTPENASTPKTPPAEASAGAAPVTPELIAQGEKIYQSAGLCYACHGSNAQGSVGPNLTDSEWLHSKGTFEEIVEQITKGVPKEQSKSGIPMPPKGGSTIGEEEIKAVAAYVYSLSHK